ncbi:MAG: hypothetical protein ACYCSO_09850 [Cuniculiplasma sp.]
MKISEVYTKLDRRCVIAIRQRSGIFSIMARMEDRIPAYPFTEEDKTYIRLFFPKTGKRNPVMSSILSREDVIEKRSYYSIIERINNVEGMRIIAKLLETPSVTLNNTYLFKDELYVDFRFHRNKLHEVNDLLSEVVSDSHNFRIVKLTVPGNLKDRMEAMHSYTPLAVVKYSIPIFENNALLKYIVANDPGTVAEIEGRSLSEKGIKVLLYTTKPIVHEGVEVISKEDNVYESYVYDKSLARGRRMENEAGIPRTAFYLTLEGERLYDTTFVPAAEADEYIAIMIDSLTVDHGSHPLLEYYSKLEKGVWEWI